MRHSLKSIGEYLLGICVVAAIIFIAALFVKGGVWLSERVYPWLVVLNAIVFFIVLLVLLPLAIFQRARAFSGAGIYISSFLFGLGLWVWCLLISYTIWGIGGVVAGILLGGIGVVPIAFLASLFHGLWPILGQVVLLVAITFGTRFLGIYLMMKSEKIPQGE